MNIIAAIEGKDRLWRLGASGARPTAEAPVAGKDQLTDFEWDLRSAYPRARLPSPEQAKPGPVPADNRLRFDDHQGVRNAGCDPIEAPQKQTDEIAEKKP